MVTDALSARHEDPLHADWDQMSKTLDMDHEWALWPDSMSKVGLGLELLTCPRWNHIGMLLHVSVLILAGGFSIICNVCFYMFSQSLYLPFSHQKELRLGLGLGLGLAIGLGLGLSSVT